VNAVDEVDAMLADLEERVQAIRDFQCQHQLERTATRKLARRMIGLARHWRTEVAAAAGTLSNSRCYAAAQRIGSADTSGPPSADRSNDASKSSRSDQVRT
jgi:hypothetical protein